MTDLVPTALDPSYELEGNAPQHRARFMTESGTPVDPDMVDSVEIFDSNDNLLRTFTPPDITNPSVGLYEVQDQQIDQPDDYRVKWTYTEQGDTDQFQNIFEVVPDVAGTTEKEVRDHILAMLGEGVMRVELPAGTMQVVMKTAKMWYAHRVGQMKRTRVQTMAGTQRYAVDPNRNVESIAAVVIEEDLGTFTDAFGGWGIFGLDQVGMNLVPAGGLFGSYGGYSGAGGAGGFNSLMVQSFQYSETYRRVLGEDFNWEWDPEAQELVLMPPPDDGREIVVEYFTTEVDLANATSREFFLVREYALAEAKEALGRIRSKYDQWEVAEGSVSLDGKDLVQEARDRKRELDEEATNFADAGWFIWG